MQILAEVIETQFNLLEGLCRPSEGIGSVEEVDKLLGQIEDSLDGKAPMWKERDALWKAAIGNYRMEPVMSFLSEDLMETLDEAYRETFHHNGKTLSEVEFSPTLYQLDNESDSLAADSVMRHYIMRLRKNVRKWISKRRRQNPTNLEQTLLDELEQKVMVFVHGAQQPGGTMPVLPLLTRSFIWATTQRLALVEDAIKWVSVRYLYVHKEWVVFPTVQRCSVGKAISWADSRSCNDATSGIGHSVASPDRATLQRREDVDGVAHPDVASLQRREEGTCCRLPIVQRCSVGQGPYTAPPDPATLQRREEAV